MHHQADQLAVSIPAAWRQPAEWVLRWALGEVLQLQASYGEHAGEHIEIRFRGQLLTLACDFFLQHQASWLQPGAPAPDQGPDWTNLAATLGGVAIAGDAVPVLWGSPGLQRGPHGGAHLRLDVTGSIFFMLSRYEEITDGRRDQYDRYPAAASLAARRAFLYRPVVDEYIEILWTAMATLWPGLSRPQSSGCLRVSCDVDEPYERWIKTPWLLAQGMAGALLRRRSLAGAVKRGRNAWRSRRGDYRDDPNWNFDWYMDTLEAAGCRASFYFIPTPGRSNYDCMYTLAEPRMQQLLRAMSARGHEIGMHGSYRSYRDGALLARERQTLIAACRSAGADTAVAGNRQHYLRWDAGQTADHLEQAGFGYDSSGGYPDQPGFRYGTARSFPMWSWQKQAPLQLRQRPLILMEASVISYLGLGHSAAAFDLMKRLKHTALRYGDFSMLWHNSSLSAPADIKLFTELLAA